MRAPPPCEAGQAQAQGRFNGHRSGRRQRTQRTRAAVRLAREGVDVTVLEGSDRLGGDTRTSETDPARPATR
ncbi:FAD-dependent oxidoreductase [Streptomyces mirabilis]|uniref:FAD-dependent oxidoreductase n=1 Tax=Streptomyces mirabilis TaxID=68239 RepID=UPI00364A2434